MGREVAMLVAGRVRAQKKNRSTSRWGSSPRSTVSMTASINANSLGRRTCNPAMSRSRKVADCRVVCAPTSEGRTPELTLNRAKTSTVERNVTVLLLKNMIFSAIGSRRAKCYLSLYQILFFSSRGVFFANIILLTIFGYPSTSLANALLPARR